MSIQYPCVMLYSYLKMRTSASLKSNSTSLLLFVELKIFKLQSLMLFMRVFNCIIYVHHGLLNQMRASLWPARSWFLKIDPVWIVGMRVRVCVCAQGY